MRQVSGEQAGGLRNRSTGNAVQQPLSILLSFIYDIKQTASVDDITYSTNYSHTAKMPSFLDCPGPSNQYVAEILKNLPMLQAILGIADTDQSNAAESAVTLQNSQFSS